MLVISLHTYGESNYYVNFNTGAELCEYFRYKSDNSIMISGHRGGMFSIYPENSLEGLKYLSSKMSIFFEVDPRLTKDSVVVLMHDATLDRTTNYSGKLINYNWEELKNVRLKDANNNITTCKIPTLGEVFDWARGKVVINLDKKDVPLWMIVDLIKKHKAEKYVMLTVHTGAQARYYYDRFPEIMFSVFLRNEKEYEDFIISGVPWKNIIAYVGWTINDKNADIIAKIRSNGVRCMVSYAPTSDKLSTKTERKIAYLEEIKQRPDIIETDIPLEVWENIP